MKKRALLIIGIIVGAIIGASSVYLLWSLQDSVTNASLPLGPIQYTCELSGGTFNNGICTCPIEEQFGQTQEMMYDQSTGFCQTTYGGSGGDAFFAGSGLPWGHYEYYANIVHYWCRDSGGSISGAACSCPSGETYSKTTGQCE